MKIKVNKHKLNIHYRGSPWGSRTQQHAYCLRYAHSHHIESHLGKKQPQAKIAIAFLFGQLHFNNVTAHALFYGGHLVMRSKRCAVQNQGITLNCPATQASTLSNCSQEQWLLILVYSQLFPKRTPSGELRVISIKVLLVISMLCKTEWSWELRMWSHKMNLLDILPTSPHYFCRKWIGATNENSNFDVRV